MRCLRCKVLGCEMVPAGFAYDYDLRDGEPWLDVFGRTRPSHAIYACTRCGHYNESVVCGGRHDGAPPIWKRVPKMYRSGGRWFLRIWWRGEFWCAAGRTPLAAIRQAWQYRAEWLHGGAA